MRIKKDQDKKIYRPKLLTPEEIRESCESLHRDNEIEARLCMINEEFRQAFYFINSYDKSVTFFGSARLTEEHPAYQQASSLAKKIVEEVGYAVVTGGGRGIMGAANRGAYDAKGKSIGLTINLPHEQDNNPWATDTIDFTYFFSRKVALAYGSEAYIFFPGGLGTLDELFEILTLKQTKKIDPIPIILVGTEFWKPFYDHLKILAEKDKTISKEDLDLFTITNDENEVIRIIKEAKGREN